MPTAEPGLEEVEDNVEMKEEEKDKKVEKAAPTIPLEALQKFVGPVPCLHKIDARCVSDNGGNDSFRINVWTKGEDPTRVVQEYNIHASFYVSYNGKAKKPRIIDKTIIKPILTQGAELTQVSTTLKTPRVMGGKQAASA